MVDGNGLTAVPSSARSARAEASTCSISMVMWSARRPSSARASGSCRSATIWSAPACCAGQRSPGSTTTTEKPSGTAASVSIRPSWPPPTMPMVWPWLTRGIVRGHAARPERAKPSSAGEASQRAVAPDRLLPVLITVVRGGVGVRLVGLRLGLRLRSRRERGLGRAEPAVGGSCGLGAHLVLAPLALEGLDLLAAPDRRGASALADAGSSHRALVAERRTSPEPSDEAHATKRTTALTAEAVRYLEGVVRASLDRCQDASLSAVASPSRRHARWPFEQFGTATDDISPEGRPVGSSQCPQRSRTCWPPATRATPWSASGHRSTRSSSSGDSG